jgi:hypothetical protein
VQSDHAQTATKGLYALGKFLQNSPQQQQRFSDQVSTQEGEHVQVALLVPTEIRCHQCCSDAKSRWPQGGMDILQKLFADGSLSRALRQKMLDLMGDLYSGGLQQEPVRPGCALLHTNLRFITVRLLLNSNDRY